MEIPDDGPGSGKVTDTGTLTDTDVDNTPNTFIAAAAGSATDHGYGTYQMTAAGVWTYTLNYSNPTVRGLNEHQHVTDTFTVHTVDGTAKVVTVTVSDDDPVSGSVGPAGVAGSEINLGLAAAPPDPGSLVTATVADLPSGWSLTGGVQVDDHTWTISDQRRAISGRNPVIRQPRCGGAGSFGKLDQTGWRFSLGNGC